MAKKITFVQKKSLWIKKTDGDRLSYVWSVSAGRIAAGQGTDHTILSTDGVVGEVTITVMVTDGKAGTSVSYPLTVTELQPVSPAALATPPRLRQHRP